MLIAPIPENDNERLASLDRMHLLSTVREADLDRVTRCVKRVFNTEIALISLIDKDRQWFKSKVGLAACETSRDISFCGHAIIHEEIFVIEDASKDGRFFDNPLVTGDPNIRFYAGQPLTNGEGFRYGTLCVIGKAPRKFTDDDRLTLEDFGKIAETLIAHRSLTESQEALLVNLAIHERDKLVDPVTGLWNNRGLEELFNRELSRALRENEPMALAILDIDHYDDLTRRYGAEMGDRAVKLTAELLLRWARTSDIVARIDESQFVMVAPNVLPSMIPSLAHKLFRGFRLAAKLEGTDPVHQLTISAGFSGAPPRSHREGLLLTLIDNAAVGLAKARSHGANRYEIEGVDDNFCWDIPVI